MKIGIPVKDKSMDSNICEAFGRTPYFLIYDSETKNKEFVENTALNSQGGAGIKAAQLIVDQRIDSLITPRCGENAALIIKEAGVNIYKSQGDSIDKNIEALIGENLSLLDEIHPGYHK